MNPFLQENTDVQGFSHRGGSMFDDFHFNSSGKYVDNVTVTVSLQPPARAGTMQ